MFLRQLRLGNLLVGNFDFQFFLRCFQLFQPSFGGLCENALLDGVQKIVDAPLGFLELFCQKRQIGILPLLHIQQHGGNRSDGFLVIHQLHRPADDQILDPVLFDRFLFTVRPLLLYGHAFVVAVDITVSPSPAFAAHIGSTVSAEQLGGQQVVVLSLVTGWGFLVLLDFLLHPLKQLLRNDGRDAIGDYNIPKTVLTDVPTIPEHLSDAVDGMLAAPIVGHIMFIQIFHNLRHGGAFIVHLERIQHKRRFHRVDLKILVTVNDVAHGGIATVELALQGILCHTTIDLFRKVSRKVFRISFQYGFHQDAFGGFGNCLIGGYNTDTIFLQNGFVLSAVIAISGKSVQLPDQHNIKQLFLTVLDHPLKFRAVIRLGRESTVNIMP